MTTPEKPPEPVLPIIGPLETALTIVMFPLVVVAVIFFLIHPSLGGGIAILALAACLVQSLLATQREIAYRRARLGLSVPQPSGRPLPDPSSSRHGARLGDEREPY